MNKITINEMHITDQGDPLLIHDAGNKPYIFIPAEASIPLRINHMTFLIEYKNGFYYEKDEFEWVANDRNEFVLNPEGYDGGFISTVLECVARSEDFVTSTILWLKDQYKVSLTHEDLADIIKLVETNKPTIDSARTKPDNYLVKTTVLDSLTFKHKFSQALHYTAQYMNNTKSLCPDDPAEYKPIIQQSLEFFQFTESIDPDHWEEKLAYELGEMLHATMTGFIRNTLADFDSESHSVHVLKNTKS